MKTVSIQCQNTACGHDFKHDLVNYSERDQYVARCPKCQRRTRFKIKLDPVAIEQDLENDAIG